MNDKKQKLYKFHFKIDEEMKIRLENLHLFRKEGDLSRLVIRVLTLLSPGLERKHLDGKQMMSRYEYVCDNKEIERKSAYVNLPDYLYRELKLMHQDLNYYSMAQLLRLVLRLFLDLAEVYGDRVEAKLMEQYLEWKAQRQKMKYRYKPVKELLFFIYQKPRISRFLTLYSNKFQPISIYRL